MLGIHVHKSKHNHYNRPKPNRQPGVLACEFKTYISVRIGDRGKPDGYSVNL